MEETARSQENPGSGVNRVSSDNNLTASASIASLSQEVLNATATLTITENNTDAEPPEMFSLTLVPRPRVRW